MTPPPPPSSPAPPARERESVRLRQRHDAAARARRQRRRAARQVRAGVRRRHLRHRQGAHRVVAGRAAQVLRLARHRHQDRPLPQPGRRHHVAVRARRGVRAARRRRGGPGPRQLRALSGRDAHARQQHHHRQDLLHRAGEGAPRRVPRKDRAGGAARHGRHPELDHARGHHAGPPRAGAGDLRHRAGRHHRRHRVDAVCGGAAAAALQRGRRELLLRVRVAGADPGRGGRAEDQAHAARREADLVHGAVAAADCVPLRGAAAGRDQEEAGAVLPGGARRGGVRARCVQHVPHPHDAAGAGRVQPADPHAAAGVAAAGAAGKVGAHGQQGGRALRAREHLHRGQVHGAVGRVPVGGARAGARGHGDGAAGGRDVGSGGGRRVERVAVAGALGVERVVRARGRGGGGQGVGGGAARGRHPGAGRVWGPRGGGQDGGDPARARREGAVPGHLPGHAAGGGGGGAARVRRAGGGLGGAQQGRGGEGGGVHAGGGQEQAGRHDAAGRAQDADPARGLRGGVAVRRGGDLRAAPPPLRGEPAAGARAGGARQPALRGRGLQRAAHGDRGGRAAPVLLRHAVPPGVHQPPGAPVAAVRGAGARRRAPARRPPPRARRHAQHPPAGPVARPPARF
ncbi:CTP synthase isoform 1 [Gracilaria domingensis]|nr:CTP synthase isoform 1 [Gracilaria domingensis]